MDRDVTVRRYLSPLRYPGGKASMAGWLADTFERQATGMDVEVWLEPFAGGAGAGLTLLDRGHVGELWLVDQNPAIAAFWAAVTEDGQALAARVEQTTPTRELYEQAKETLHQPDTADPFDLGYAAFIINRCSRSGIIAPRAGAMPDLGARFNAPALAERIRHIHSMAGSIRVHHGDGIGFLEDLPGSGIDEEVFSFVDPPYIREGERLYANGFDQAAHQRLADALNQLDGPWVLTYDDEPAVEAMYPGRRILNYAIRNTAGRARVAREYAVFSDSTIIDEQVPVTSYADQHWVRAA